MLYWIKIIIRERMVALDLLTEYKKIAFWSWTASGLQYTTSYQYGAEQATLTAAELESLRPGLADTLQRLYALHAQDCNNTPLRGPILGFQLHHLQHPYALQTIDHTTCWVWSLASLGELPSSPRALAHGWFYKVNDDGLVHHVTNGTQTVDPAWLDAQYPGWRKRMDLADDWGLSPEDCARYVFDTTPQPLTQNTPVVPAYGA